jgi:hypothetical protein
LGVKPFFYFLFYKEIKIKKMNKKIPVNPHWNDGILSYDNKLNDIIGYNNANIRDNKYNGNNIISPIDQNIHDIKSRIFFVP